MKGYSLLLIIFFSFAAIGQSSDSVVTLIPERSVALNGGGRAMLGGKSRTYIKVDLPKNTKKWYYSFSTTPDYSGTEALNLSFQLVSALSTQGSLSSLTSYIKVPRGTGSADILLCDHENINKFLSKDDKWFGTIARYTEGSIYNAKQGVVEIDDVTSGTLYLGLKNPGAMDAVNIRIEVVAIVDFSTEGSWSKEIADAMHEEFRKNLLENDVERSIAESMATCMTEYLISNYSFDEVSMWNEVDRKNFERGIKENCVDGESSCQNQDQANVFGNLGWTYFENGKIDESIKYGKKALTLCKEDMEWVEANIGLGYLVQDSIDLALEYYVQAITSSRNSTFGKQYIKAAIDDLEKYEAKYKIIGRHPEIIDLLMIEL